MRSVSTGPDVGLSSAFGVSARPPARNKRGPQEERREWPKGYESLRAPFNTRAARWILEARCPRGIPHQRICTLDFGSGPEHRNQQRKQTLAGRPIQSSQRAAAPRCCQEPTLPPLFPFRRQEKRSTSSELLWFPWAANGLSIITQLFLFFADTSETLRPSIR